MGSGGGSNLVFRARPVLRTDWSIASGKRRAAALQRRPAGEVLVPVDVHGRRCQDALHGRHLIQTGAAALDQRDA